LFSAYPGRDGEGSPSTATSQAKFWGNGANLKTAVSSCGSWGGGGGKREGLGAGWAGSKLALLQ